MNLKPGLKVKSRIPELIAIEEAKIMFSHKNPSAIIEEKIADFCKLSKPTIRLLKLGRATGCIYTALKLADFFNTTVENIFYIEEEQQ